MRSRHRGLLPHKHNSVHATGSTPRHTCSAWTVIPIGHPVRPLPASRSIPGGGERGEEPGQLPDRLLRLGLRQPKVLVRAGRSGRTPARAAGSRTAGASTAAAAAPAPPLAGTAGTSDTPSRCPSGEAATRHVQLRQGAPDRQGGVFHQVDELLLLGWGAPHTCTALHSTHRAASRRECGASVVCPTAVPCPASFL